MEANFHAIKTSKCPDGNFKMSDINGKRSDILKFFSDNFMETLGDAILNTYI